MKPYLTYRMVQLVLRLVTLTDL